MDFQELQANARDVRAQYAAMETARYGREWTSEEIMLGFVGDVGDLAKLVQGRPECVRGKTSTMLWPTSWPTACGA